MALHPQIVMSALRNSEIVPSSRACAVSTPHIRSRHMKQSDIPVSLCIILIPRSATTVFPFATAGTFTCIFIADRWTGTAPCSTSASEGTPWQYIVPLLVKREAVWICIIMTDTSSRSCSEEIWVTPLFSTSSTAGRMTTPSASLIAADYCAYSTSAWCNPSAMRRIKAVRNQHTSKSCIVRSMTLGACISVHCVSVIVPALGRL